MHYAGYKHDQFGTEYRTDIQRHEKEREGSMSVRSGKVTIKFDKGTPKRATAVLNEDGTLNYLEYRGEVFGGSKEFDQSHRYQIMIVSDKYIRNALERSGFVVKDMERINKPLHLRLPVWEIDLLDKLKQTEFLNHSRSDIINKILLDSLPASPPDYPYEKAMTKTTFTINPIVLSKLESVGAGSGRTLSHLIYDYVTEFCQRYT